MTLMLQKKEKGSPIQILFDPYFVELQQYKWIISWDLFFEKKFVINRQLNTHTHASAYTHTKLTCVALHEIRIGTHWETNPTAYCVAIWEDTYQRLIIFIF